MQKGDGDLSNGIKDNFKGYAINGLFLTKNSLGITRFANELIRELDRIVKDSNLQIVVPEWYVGEAYKNIRLVHFGRRQGIAWEQLDFAKYLSSVDTKKSPFFYTARLMVAQKYLATGDKASADKILDEIIQDENAPASVVSNAQLLK